jgi:hypothetical protein
MSHRIEWQRERRRILLPVLVLAPYPITDLIGAEAIALIDTGSSVSGIAVGLAQTLNLVGLGKRPLKSAQGEGHVERYAFRIGLTPNAIFDEIVLPFIFEEVIGIELTNAFEFNALIGMDILGQCDFTCARNGNCSLSFG